MRERLHRWDAVREMQRRREDRDPAEEKVVAVAIPDTFGLEVKFWGKVEISDHCWNWTGANSGERNYGKFYAGGGRGPYRLKFVHRLSWEWHFGSIPKGKLVLHHCDNRRCVRPSHLFLGTSKDNARDMAAKGRQWLQKADPKTRCESAARMRAGKR
jgi:hypothetical protein